MVWISSLVTLSIGAIPRDAIGGTEVCCNTRTRWLEFWMSTVVFKYGMGFCILTGIRILLSVVFVVRRRGILIVISDGIERNCNADSYYI